MFDGISNLLKGFVTLSQDINKVSGNELDENVQGVFSDFEPDLKVDIGDDKLIKLTKKWELDWRTYYNAGLKQREEKSEEYWVGKGGNGIINNLLNNKGETKEDNIIFEALETFLPAATGRNPEPVVSADNTPEGISIAKKVQKMLVALADTLTLKLKLKSTTRHWALYFRGCIKIGWSQKTDNIVIKVIRPQKLILDKDATIDENGVYTGEFIGQFRRSKAEALIKRFPSKKDFINKMSNKQGGTKIQYIEWWTDEILFWTLKGQVLDKVKNPHWNYDDETERPLMIPDELGELVQETDEDGDPIFEVETIAGKNHFPHPKKPFVFLSIFNNGTRPHDNTSLIEQNIPQQDRINRRNTQIDLNIQSMNAGWVISRANAGIQKGQAGRIAESLMKGGVTTIPSGTPDSAIKRVVGTGLPSDVFNDLVDARGQLRNIFGTTGISSPGLQQEKTVRGKIIARQTDTTRIGGGITEYLEQFADTIYNWMVQMIYVYYDEEHVESVMGEEGASEYIKLKNSQLTKKLRITVREGSLIPKDQATLGQQAVELFIGGGMDPLSMYEALDHPNPKQAVDRLTKWLQDPNSLRFTGGGQANEENPEVPISEVPISQE